MRWPDLLRPQFKRAIAESEQFWKSPIPPLRLLHITNTLANAGATGDGHAVEWSEN
jgi:hypothetical protein